MPFHLLRRTHPTGAAAVVALRNARVFFGAWKSNLIPPLVEPILWLAALGYGLGAFVDEVDGVPYILFIAPALIALEAMNSSFFECGYGSFIRMHYQKTYKAITSTPLSLDDVVMGELLWGASRAAVNGVFVLVVLMAFGLIAHPALLLALPIVVLSAFTFGAIGLLTSAVAPGFDTFNYPMYLYITPQFFLSGTFFPLSQFPPALQYLAWTLPLTHTAFLCRSLAGGIWGLPQTMSLAWLIVVGAVLSVGAINAMKRRLIP